MPAAAACSRSTGRRPSPSRHGRSPQTPRGRRSAPGYGPCPNSTTPGCAVTVDPLHLQVVAQRFNDDDSWRLRCYAVPIPFPQVGDLPWEVISDLRRDRNIARFRAVLRGVEEEATAEAAGGDIEAAASHAYRRHLAAAVGRLDGIGSGALRSAVALIVIGGAAGSATFGITGPLNLVAGTALGSAAGVIVDVRKILRQRRSRGWVAVHQRIDGLRM